MVIERQISWGGMVALYMFLSGTGAGIYVTSFALRFFGNPKWLAVTGMTLGPILVISGLILLLLKEGRPLQSYRLFKGLATSLTSRGGLIQILFIILGLGYALPGFWFSGWLDSLAGMALGSIALILALGTAIYHGMVLTESRAIPLWSSSVMPLLSFFTALTAGLGLLFLISPTYLGLYGTGVVKGFDILEIAGISFVIGELISIWSLMSARTNAIYAGSIKSIKTSMITSVICLFLALLLLFSFAIASEVTYFSWVSLILGILLLAGGFITRYSILKAGYYIPMRIPMSSF